MKTLALVAILRNERHNLEPFLSSFKGCVDHVYLCDTGSTDGSIEWIEKNAASVVGCPVSLTHFTWVNDFAAARNFAMKDVKEDFWMWADLDDSLSEPEAFKTWKQYAMPLAEMWMAPYHYGFDANGVCQCQFVRERVMKTSKGFAFYDFVHEGVKPPEGTVVQGIDKWWITHRRTEAEQKADKGRNLDILVSRYQSLSPRLHAYLGKEFFDNGKFKEAVEELEKVLKYPESVLKLNDRVMACQYVAMAHMQLKNYPMAIKYAQIGTHLDPLRAEFYCIVGDAWFASQNLHNAIPWYRAATGCFNRNNGMSALFTFDDMYSVYPREQLTKLYFNIGEYELAEIESRGLPSEVSQEIGSKSREVLSSRDRANPVDLIDCDDIVFTCLASAYPWDGEVYRQKGIGGSETACVEMAEHLAALTKRQVKVFNQRQEKLEKNGVVYLPLQDLQAYLCKWRPAVHIAWRHTQKLTTAKTYVWSHDLLTPGAERWDGYHKLICLSDFHQGYVRANQGVPVEKIFLSRNGLNPARFDGLKTDKKQHGKVIWPNSPDRGLDYAIAVMDEVRKTVPFAELHVFYGLDNLYKYGLGEKADQLKAMMAARPWIKYHGNVDQKTLAEELASSEVWLYPANFIETFCITALEALACRAYPVTRPIGALMDTLKKAGTKGMADVLDLETDEASIKVWAAHVIDAIELKKWHDIGVNTLDYAWQEVAREWIAEMEL